MKPLLECVPNFSEGKDAQTVQTLVDTMAAVDGVSCLAHEMDAAHNRCVITLAGEPDAVAEAAFRGAAKAKEVIDLRNHVGEHKRMGAMDVCPFTPLGSATMDLATRTAQQVAERIGTELELPVFLYGKAARREDRRILGNVRNKQFEGLLDLVGKDPDYEPDYGPTQLHPTAGAVGVGARTFLIAYNINLKTEDVGIAKAISKEVRERDGGLPRVQAMGFYLDDRKMAQVSMNLLDYEVTSIRTVFDTVAAKAQAAGVEIEESELVGLVPKPALDEETAAHIQLRGFDPKQQVVEERLSAAGIC
ncbi:MAG: glutamate formimidoyltransferase [Planctomycetota bacterium]|jgi:glutamate formiminotransferase